MIPSGGVMTGISGIDIVINFPFKVMELFWKESINIDTKKTDKSNRNNLDLIWLVKMIKEKIGSRITLKINKIKDIMKVIKYLENRGKKEDPSS